MAAHSTIREFVTTIEQSIAKRGYYVLMDNRLEWICGKGGHQQADAPKNASLIKAFAKKHGWEAEFERNRAWFRPRSKSGAT